MCIKTTGTSMSLLLPMCWINGFGVQQGVVVTCSNICYYMVVLVLSVLCRVRCCGRGSWGVMAPTAPPTRRPPSILGLLCMASPGGWSYSAMGSSPSTPTPSSPFLTPLKVRCYKSQCPILKVNLYQTCEVFILFGLGLLRANRCQSTVAGVCH